MSVIRLAAGDDFAGQYRDQKTMVEAVLGRLKIAALEAGWTGMKIFDARWTRGEGSSPDGVLIEVELAARGEIGVDDVSKFLRGKQRKAAA